MLKPTFHSEIRSFLGKKAVLVIEPTLNYKSSIRSFLTNLKLTHVKFASSIREARREMLITKIGLFIVEWDLDEENGLQFCRSLRQEASVPKAPYLLMTVENRKQDVVLASEVGIDGYLLKPFSFEDFAEAIHHVVLNFKKPSKLNQLINQGEEALRSEDLEEALAYFKAAEEENPTSARAVAGQAKVCHHMGKHDDAKALYRKAIAYNPEYVDAYRDLLEVLTLSSSASEVYDLAEKVNLMSPGNPKYTMILAKASLELGKVVESENYFKMTIRLSPRLAEAYKGLGKVNSIQEDYQSAMKNFSKALDLDSQDVSTLNSLGLLYVKLDRIEEGVEKYRAALKLQPQDSRILFNLGYAKEKLGDLAQAAFYYNQAILYRPNFGKARRRLESLPPEFRKKTS